MMATRGGINARSTNGKTLVEIAIARYGTGAAAIVAALRAEGADLELLDEDGNRLLHRAVMACNVEGVKILLANQVDADALNLRTTPAIAHYAHAPEEIQAAMQAPHWTWGDEDKATPLHLAAAFGNDPALIDALAWYVRNIDPTTPSLETPLKWAAIFSANPQVIRQLVSYGADVNIKGRDGGTPLHAAAMCSNHPDIMIPALLERGAILEARNDIGWTALHHLAAYPNRRACVALIAGNANVHACTNNNRTPVEIAVTCSRPGAAAIVTELKAAGADLELPDATGNTLLHRVVMLRSPAGIDMLLAHGVNVNAFNTQTGPTIAVYAQPHIEASAMQRPNWSWGNTDQATPLHLAAAFGHDPQLIRTLIRAGANPNAANAAGDTPLHWAATFSDSPEVLTALIDGGADKDRIALCGWSALSAACENTRDLQIVAALVTSGANVNSGGVGTSPAERAIVRHPADAAALITLLKDAGADLELPDADGNHLLHREVMAGNLLRIEVLLTNGVDVNARNTRTLPTIARYSPEPRTIATLMQNPQCSWGESDNVTPLHMAAAFSNNPALIRMLTRHGANANAMNDSHETPMHWAAGFANNTEIIDALVEAGASTTQANMSTLTPLQNAAATNSNPRMIDVLIEYGADIEATDSLGVTALQVAAIGPAQAEVIRALIRHGARIDVGAEENNTPLHVATIFSYALELVAAFKEFNIRLDSYEDEIGLVQEHLNCGYSHNADVMLCLIELGANPEIQRALELQIQELIVKLHETDMPQGDPNLTPAVWRQFLGRLNTDTSLTLLALQYRPATRIATATPTNQLENLRISQTARAPQNTAASASSAPEVATWQHQLANLPRLLSHPLVQSVERWYNDTNPTTQRAHATAWHAIKDEPHANEFRDFLAHLHETADYRHPQLRPDYIRRITQLLTAIQTSPALRQQSFLLVEDATSSCGDRVGLTLNNLDMARIEHEAEHGQHSAQDLINIRTSQFRIQILGEWAQQKIVALRPILGNRLDELEVIHGAVTLLAEELKLIGVSRTMLYGSYAHFTDDDKRTVRALITQREGRGEYVKFIAEWQPWQKQLRRIRPADFDDLDRRISSERDSLAEQPDYTSDHDYVELCRRMEDMQRARLAFSLENWTREWLVQNRRHQI